MIVGRDLPIRRVQSDISHFDEHVGVAQLGQGDLLDLGFAWADGPDGFHLAGRHCEVGM